MITYDNLSLNINYGHQKKLEVLGFRLKSAGVHAARTIMLEDLASLLSYVNNPDAVKDDYRRAIIEDNCLGKRSGKTRSITYSHLTSLYGLDQNILIFGTMLYFWNRDPHSRPLLALLCAYCRDDLLRQSFSFIRETNLGARVNRQDLEEFIEQNEPERFSPATRMSLAQNLNSSWTKSGHLRGGTKKYRSRAKASCGSVCYALFLGHITGVRGQSLFNSEYCELFDSSFEDLLEFAQEGSRRGWIVFKRIADVMEVQFPSLIKSKETAWINEQS